MVMQPIAISLIRFSAVSKGYWVLVQPGLRVSISDSWASNSVDDLGRMFF